MKARVKATGDIIEIDERCSYVYAKNYDKFYSLANLEFLDIKENETPDYWTRLEHQAAIAAMQTMLATLYNSKFCVGNFESYTKVDSKEIARLSKVYAHALVEKYKKEEKK